MNIEFNSTIFKRDDKGKYNDVTNEFLKKFTLEDFQFGDIITLRKGGRYVYIDEHIYGESEVYSMDGDFLVELYDNDLKCICEYVVGAKESYDIVKVERQGQIVFQREEEVEMTLSEVCEKLGYNVKIVKEKSEE